ncbi:hypothetical protein [Senegalia massiliensis]|uniref:NERD domain-containing protein n=1 Tax=Senegalia massiliensis TaxID=1720316 RepID=A0A845R052_9CLOT|nr:hypothetical protein [Senegalia massiliensis]NBI06828.1 hypothetical protein [Senegalia massiliensis]
MNEYELRGKLISHVENIIDEGFEDYIRKYGDNIRNLVIYPLLDLEMSYEESNPANINNYLKRYTISLLLHNAYDYIKDKKLNIEVNKGDYNNYRNKKYPILRSIMQDFRVLQEIKDGNSFAKSELKKESKNSYRLITSLVTNKYKEEVFYYHGFNAQEEFNKEQKMIIDGLEKYTLKYLPKKRKDLKKLDRLIIDIDEEMLEHCNSLVYKDIKKLGEKTKSKVINKIEDTKKVIGFLYYLSFIKRIRNMLYSSVEMKKTITPEDYLMSYDKQWLINKIGKITMLSNHIITNHIEFLTFRGKGSIIEFPLINVKNKIVTIPSLLQLNDFHFNLANGHYRKKIDFIKRDNTVSKTVIDNMINKVKFYNNIVISKEKYYEFMYDKAKIKSDIDIALYDVLHNKLLIIECKWKDNHYINEIDKNHVKIQSTVNKIFKKQISKHKKFLRERKNIYYIFDNNKRVREIKESPDILYIGVDKRNQLHLENMHMITIYMIQFFFDKYGDKDRGILNLKDLFKEIRSLKTKVEYITTEIDKKIKLGELTIISDDLDLEYKF